MEKVERSQFVKNLWLWKCGQPEVELSAKKDNILDMPTTEWSQRFEMLMRNRLWMGAIRYGVINEPGKPKYDYMTSIVSRAKLYRQTGNQELLVDIANLCLVEFEQKGHPLAHFESIDDGDHVRVK